jgi:type IV pilus assembly protein PilC
MPRYNYIALDARGQESSGVLDAGSQNDAVAQLRQAGYFPKSISEEGRGSKLKAKGRAQGAGSGSRLTKDIKLKINLPFLEKKTVKPRTLMIFTRQLATLIDAGLPLLRGLTVLSKQEPDPVLKNTITSIADSVQAGGTFSEALTGHPKIFNKLYVNMVKAGELGGVLEIVLLRLAEFQEKAQKIKNKVVAAMFYPAIVLIIAVLIMALLLAFVVPKFKAIFDDMLGGKPLPPLTEFVIGLSTMVQNYWYIILGLGALIFAGYKFFSRTPKGAAVIDAFLLRAPVIGDLTRKSSISRFSRTLGTLVTSGVPILQALNITRETAGNAVVADAITKVHDSVREGESIVQPLEASSVFPPMVISMIDVGEETGQLPEMLLKIADVYDDEVDNAVTGLTSLLEPVMMVFLAVVVGTLVIALFLPMVSIITGIQNQ